MLLIVSTLCIVQFVWTLVHERVSGFALVGSLLAVVAFNGVFHVLYSLGHSPQSYDDEDEFHPSDETIVVPVDET